ncbi:MAG: hypothetical protein IKS49_04340 [Actinomycetaceae bacterium]|nr:hypothetical protein [Actinomycetaceae bacterium]
MKNRKTKAAITLALSASGLMMTPLLAVADEPSTPDDSVANVPSAHQADLPGESGEVTPAPEPPSAPSEPSPSPDTTSNTETGTNTPSAPGEPGDSGEPGEGSPAQPGEPPASTEGTDDTGTGEQPGDLGDSEQEQPAPTPTPSDPSNPGEPGEPGDSGESGEVTPAPEPPSAPSEPSPSPSVPSVPQPAPVNIVERIVPLPAAPVDWGAANTPSAPGGREGTLTLPVTGAPAAPASAGTSSGLNRVAPSSSQLPVQELAKTGADDPWHGAWLAGGLIGLGTIMIRRAHTAPVAAAPRRRGKHAM